MRQAIPARDPLTTEDGKPVKWPETWLGWFSAVLRALVWNISLTATKTHDFGNIAAHSEDSTTVTVTGARTDNPPTVLVTPLANTAGIIYKGVVTADNTVTIYALNATGAGVNPLSTTFRVVVLQP